MSMLPQLIAVWNGIDHLVLQIRDGRTLRGNRLEGLLSWTAPVGPDGLDLSRVIVAIVDVTGIRSAHEDLEALVKSRDELVATVSHELRTPLTTVVGLSHELRDAFHSFDRDEVIELVGLIAQQSNEVATIVEDLLVAARTRGGSLGVSSRPVDLAHEAKATLQSLGLSGGRAPHRASVPPVGHRRPGTNPADSAQPHHQRAAVRRKQVPGRRPLGRLHRGSGGARQRSAAQRRGARRDLLSLLQNPTDAGSDGVGRAGIDGFSGAREADGRRHHLPPRRGSGIYGTAPRCRSFERAAARASVEFRPRAGQERPSALDSRIPALTPDVAEQPISDTRLWPAIS